MVEPLSQDSALQCNASGKKKSVVSLRITSLTKASMDGSPPDFGAEDLSPDHSARLRCLPLATSEHRAQNLVHGLRVGKCRPKVWIELDKALSC